MGRESPVAMKASNQTYESMRDVRFTQVMGLVILQAGGIVIRSSIDRNKLERAVFRCCRQA